MNWIQITLIVLFVILAIGGVIYLIYKKNIAPKMDQYNDLLKKHKQSMSIFVIDKFRDKLTNQNMPKNVIDQIPKLLRGKKLSLVKAKVGPQISVLIADEKIFKHIPTKKMIKADVAGMYIVNFKS